MRELILQRIEEIRIKENNFPPTTTRWNKFWCDGLGTHISIFNFNYLNDSELLKLFERIIRRYYTQM